MNPSELIGLQVALKVRGSLEFKNWSRDLEQYRKFCLYIAENIKPHAPKYSQLIDSYIKVVKEAKSIDEILEAAKVVWVASGGILDLAP